MVQRAVLLLTLMAAMLLAAGCVALFTVLRVGGFADTRVPEYRLSEYEAVVQGICAEGANCWYGYTQTSDKEALARIMRDIAAKKHVSSAEVVWNHDSPDTGQDPGDFATGYLGYPPPSSIPESATYVSEGDVMVYIVDSEKAYAEMYGKTWVDTYFGLVPGLLPGFVMVLASALVILAGRALLLWLFPALRR